MAIREIVIQLSEDVYKETVRTEAWNEYEKREIRSAIRNGIFLPKKHGRIGDLDALEEEMSGSINAGLMIDGYENYPHINDTEDCLECVKYADTLIKANCSTPVLKWYIEKRKSKNENSDSEK